MFALLCPPKFAVGFWILSQLALVALAQNCSQEVYATRSVAGQLTQPQQRPLDTKGENKDLRVKQQQQRYAVVIDCGSSGSRARIFHWPAGTPARLLPEAMRSVRDKRTGGAQSMRVRPGISTFGTNPEAASDYLRPLLQFATEVVPREAHLQTNVYILATAGMRLLDERKQRAIWADIERDTRREFAHFGSIRARLISGPEEGAFLWLSVNSLAGRLDEQYDQAPGFAFQLLQAVSARRFGVLEMGGASAQVTFEVSSARLDQLISGALNPTSGARQVFRQSRLTYALARASQQEQEISTLFSVTFLGFGSDAARSLYVDLLARNSLARKQLAVVPANSTLVVADPCLNRGAYELVDKPLELVYGQTKTIGYQLGERSSAALQVALLGSGNFKRCAALLFRLVAIAKRERTTCSSSEPPSLCGAPLIGTNFVPWRQLQFVGLGEPFYTQGELFGWPGPTDGPRLLANVVRLCSLDYQHLEEELMARDYSQARRNHLLGCFKASWLLVWLSGVLRMPLEVPASGRQYDLIAVDRFSASEQLDWTLGALLAHQPEFELRAQRANSA